MGNEAQREPPSLKGVTVRGPLCAELPALPGENRDKDWIDVG